MSYRCDNCQSIHTGRILRAVTETRKKSYGNGAHGTETVKEMKLCYSCHKGVEAGLPLITLRKAMVRQQIADKIPAPPERERELTKPAVLFGTLLEEKAERVGGRKIRGPKKGNHKLRSQGT